MDKASDFESEDCGFESRRGHFWFSRFVQCRNKCVGLTLTFYTDSFIVTPEYWSKRQRDTDGEERTCIGHTWFINDALNDRIATQIYSSLEIPIGSRVMSRTTSAPSGRRSRKMVANVAGCRSFCTFRDCHTSIAFTPVGPQPNLAHIFGWIWD